jgi:hypothetical protein
MPCDSSFRPARDEPGNSAPALFARRASISIGAHTMKRFVVTTMMILMLSACAAMPKNGGPPEAFGGGMPPGAPVAVPALGAVL